MKNRKIYIISVIVMIIALGFWAINRIYSLPDWGVRVLGIIIFADLVVLSYYYRTMIKYRNR